MYPTAAEALTLASRVRTLAMQVDDVDIVILPPVIWLPTLAAALDHRPQSLGLGAQNFFPKDQGAYTGEISLPMIKGLASYVLIGHSERRTLFGETDEMINEKLTAALAAGFKPILCVGELTKVALTQRGRGRATVGDRRSNIFHQLAVALEGISHRHIERLVLAYEPLWAIGTGVSVSGVHVDAILAALRAQLADRYGKTVAERIRTVYGGSVSEENIEEYQHFENIDGVLVGGASLKMATFGSIVQAVATHAHHTKQHTEH